MPALVLRKDTHWQEEQQLPWLFWFVTLKMTGVSFSFKGNIRENSAKLNLTKWDRHVKITHILYNKPFFLKTLFFFNMRPGEFDRSSRHDLEVHG